MREALLAGTSPRSPAAAPGKPPATPMPQSGGAGLDGSSSLEGLSLSSWRYASAAVSADSNGGHAAAGVAHSAGGSRRCSAEAAAMAGDAVPVNGSVDTPLFGSSDTPMPATERAVDPVDPSSRQLWSPSKRPQPSSYPGGSHSGSYQHPVGGPPPPAAAAPAALHSFVPHGMDAASYAAGERAAFMCAFQQALPGQQALGQLFSAVDALHSRLEEEVQQWRQLQMGATKTSTMVETALQRLDTVEFMRLPQLQEKWEVLACRAPQHLADLLARMQEVVTLLVQQRQQPQQHPGGGSGGSSGSFARRQLHWLLLAAAGYGQSLLSGADVAALFLSRKILLTNVGGIGGSVSRQLRSALGALLFVASVEATWQMQGRALRGMPGIAQRMAAPAQLGLRLGRVAVWSAALVLAAARTRAACQSASDSVVAVAEAAAGAIKLPACLQPLLFWQRRWEGRGGEMCSGGCGGASSGGQTCCAKTSEVDGCGCRACDGSEGERDEV